MSSTTRRRRPQQPSSTSLGLGSSSTPPQPPTQQLVGTVRLTPQHTSQQQEPPAQDEARPSLASSIITPDEDSSRLREKREKDRQLFARLSQLVPGPAAATSLAIEKPVNAKPTSVLTAAGLGAQAGGYNDNNDDDGRPASSSQGPDIGEQEPLHRDLQPKKIKIKDWDWIEYAPGARQINYMRDFLRANKDQLISKVKLGIASQTFEDKQMREKRKLMATQNSFTAGLIKSANTNPTSSLEEIGASGARKYRDTAMSLEERIIKFGRVNVSVVGSNLMDIEGVKSSELEFQDMKRLAHKDNMISDYFCLKGGPRDLLSCDLYLKRDRSRHLLDKIEEKQEQQDFYNEKTSEEASRRLESGFWPTGQKKSRVRRDRDDAGEEC